ncbi:hypothetical protein LDO51_07020 [Providencia alcalifaciens]|uniref:hypothetical protein n=1 Tax=Providencia alcalifaciens TaxID=126385 RepID=UPI001CE0BDB9|nr:hypothetical protein [Providencia alcalifaciens]UBX50528.1 hypothetical protein LDO51_07020 [Providencia alcalifaciens]
MMEITSTINHVRQTNLQSAAQATDNQTRTASHIGEALSFDPQADAFQQADQAFRQLGYDVAETSFREETVSSDLDKIKVQYRSMMMASKHSADLYKHIPEPVDDGRAHIDGLKEMIDNIHSGYQKNYGEVVKAATKYMEAVNSGLGKMSTHLEGASEGKIKLFKYRMINSMNDAVSGYFKNTGNPPSISLLSSPNTDTSHMKILKKMFEGYPSGDQSVMLNYLVPLASFDAKGNSGEFWKKKLSGQGFVVIEYKNQIHIYPDMAPLKKIYDSMNELNGAEYGEIAISSQIFQSFQTAVDSHKNTTNSSVSRLLETFRQDNSHFDTLVQLLIQLIKDLNQNNNSLINM